MNRIKSRNCKGTLAFSFLTFFLIIVLTGCTSGTVSKKPVGTVKKVRDGKLEKRERFSWKALAPGEKVYANDRLRTDSTAVAVLSVRKTGSFLLGPDSEFTLGENLSDFKTTLSSGYVWFKSRLAKGKKMSVSTSSAIAGVRGTKFSVLNDAEGTDVCTCEGIVKVVSKEGKTVTVGSGMYSSIDLNGQAGKPGKGKILLAKLWKEKLKRYSPCLECHRKGKKPKDNL